MLSDTQNLVLKSARLGDATKSLEFIRAYYAHNGIPFDEASIHRGLNVLRQDPSLGRAFLIQNSEQAVGYLILIFGFDLEFGGRQATVTNVFVEQGHRGKGLGSKVFAQLENIRRSLGVGVLELQVEEGNLGAQSFYKKRGFRRGSRIPISKILT